MRQLWSCCRTPVEVIRVTDPSREPMSWVGKDGSNHTLHLHTVYSQGERKKWRKWRPCRKGPSLKSQQLFLHPVIDQDQLMWGTELDPDRGPLWVREQWGKGQRSQRQRWPMLSDSHGGCSFCPKYFFFTAKVNIFQMTIKNYSQPNPSQGLKMTTNSINVSRYYSRLIL